MKPFTIDDENEIALGERDARKLFFALFANTIQNRKVIELDYFYSIRGSLTIEQVKKFYPLAVEAALKEKKIRRIASIDITPLYESNCI